MPSWKKVITSGSNASLNSLYAPSITGSLLGTASFATQALSSSFATTASFITTAQTASYVLNAVSASFASTASAVNTLNQNVLITGSLTVGASSIGASENTLTLGPRDNGSEGGQIMLQAPGGTYTSASMWDNYANQTRLLRGSNAGSDALVASFNMHTKQMQLAAYNNVSAFPGTAAAFLAVDSSGNLITTSSAGGGGSVTINNNVDNYVITATGTLNTLNGESNLQFNGTSLTVTGQITSSGAIISQANGAMYFRGGDDAEFWDINVANTVGIYGQQNADRAGLKLGSSGATLFGTGSRFGIGTIAPVATLDVNGNLYVASGITGSLLGTASFATQALSASYAPSAPAFPYTGSALITGSLSTIGSFNVQTYDGVSANAFIPAIEITNTKRNIYDTFGSSSINADGRLLIGNTGAPALSWISRTVFDSVAAQSIDWNQRFLYDITGTNASIDWNNRTSYDSLGNSSINWNNRSLLDSSNTAVVSWDAFALNYKVETYTYLKRFIDSTTQESFSNVPTVAFNYEGEVIQATLDASVNQFDLVYLETDSKWYPVTQGTADCTKLLGICAETGIRPKVILEGSITVNDGTFTDTPLVQNVNFGLPIYVRDSTGNSMSTIVPTTAGQYVRILGHVYYQNTVATNYWTIKFRPSNEWYII